MEQRNYAIIENYLGQYRAAFLFNFLFTELKERETNNYRHWAVVQFYEEELLEI